MKHVKDFFSWLFAFGTPEFFPLMFVLGAVFTILFGTIIAFAISPLFGVSLIMLLTFGIPVVAYVVSRSRGGN